MMFLHNWFPLVCSMLWLSNAASQSGDRTNLSVGTAAANCDSVVFAGASSSVCRCNGTYCDTIPKIGEISAHTYTTIISSKSGVRFAISKYSLESSSSNTSQAYLAATGQMVINTNVTYQSVVGFGGALTDAAGINIYHNLKPDSRQKLLESYYSPNGIEYTLGRIPIGSTDFSTHSYSYDDMAEDFNLTKFSLVEEDLQLKIPLAKAAKSLSRRNIRFFSSPWTAPAWMKTDDAFTGRGFLKGSAGGPYYKAWANYLIKFLDSYKDQGVEFWGMTAQNEPIDGRIPFFPFQCMGFSDKMQRDFIATDLGPALNKSGYGHLKLMILDDDLLMLPLWAKTIYGNQTANQYVSGLGIHWYLNGYLHRDRITETHQVDPTKFILSTEACAGSGPLEKKVVLGSWERAEQYAEDIIKDLQNWVVGWTDWNIALNMSGGPNWVNNDVDSPIIVNPQKNEFYKQPMFYAMGHFSKYLLPGSKRLDSQITGLEDSEGVAFLTPEKNIVLQFLNSGGNDQVLQIKENTKNFSISIPARTIMTVIWKL